MSLQKMKRADLDLHLKGLVKKEQDLLHQILETICEIDSRRMYLEMGYPSLFEYLTQGVGYSNASAQRRIDAARLLREVPELAGKIQSGQIKLNQISLLQKAARQVAKTSHKKVLTSEKVELLETLSGQTAQQSQKEIASFFDLPVLEFTKQTVQANDSVRIELTLSKDIYEKLQRAQALISSAVPERDLVQFIEYVSEKIIQQRTVIRETSRHNKNDHDLRESLSRQSQKQKIKIPNQNSKNRVSIPAKTFSLPMWKRQAHGRQDCCQYKDPVTGKICGGCFFLQVDHKQSRWAQGTNSPDNLQILCAGHNSLKYRQEAGTTLRKTAGKRINQ